MGMAQTEADNASTRFWQIEAAGVTAASVSLQWQVLTYGPVCDLGVNKLWLFCANAFVFLYTDCYVLRVGNRCRLPAGRHIRAMLAQQTLLDPWRAFMFC